MLKLNQNENSIIKNIALYMSGSFLTLTTLSII
jgi:hypothetical protein